MGKSIQETRILNMPIGYVVDKMRRIDSSNLRVSLKSENPVSQSEVWFRVHHGTSFSSWGEKITVTLVAISPNSTQITVLSECGMPTQIVDWGKNQSNVVAVFDYLAR